MRRGTAPLLQNGGVTDQEDDDGNDDDGDEEDDDGIKGGKVYKGGDQGGLVRCPSSEPAAKHHQ
eukprot:534431-Pelagomonas_calceolata.AAC.4